MFIKSHVLSCRDGEVNCQAVDSVKIADRATLRVHISGDVNPRQHAAMLRQIADYLDDNTNYDAA